MKKRLFMALIATACLLFAASAWAQMGYGQGTPPGEGWFCPYCGTWHGNRGMTPGSQMGPGWGYGMGSSMTPGWGSHGPGMMHRWGGMGSGMMRRHWYGAPDYRRYQGRQDHPLEKEEARQMIQEYLDLSHNPNLEIGGIEDKGRVFEAEIVTKEQKDLVDRLQIDKRTAWMRSVYE